MKTKESNKYWEIVREALIKNKDNPTADPAEWNDASIEDFIMEMNHRVIKFCRDNTLRQKNFGMKLHENKAIRNTAGKGLWSSIDLKTFKNIFKNGEGGNRKRTKDAFAIYLGYDSYAQLENETIHNNQSETKTKTKNTESKVNNSSPTKKKRDLLPLWIFLGFTGLFSIKNTWTNPLVLFGMALLLFFGIHRLIIRSGLLSPIDKMESSAILKLILKYGFYIALALTIGGIIYANLGIINGTNISKTSFKLISKQSTNDVLETGFLIRSFKDQSPKTYRALTSLEDKSKYDSELLGHYRTINNDLKHTIEKYPLTMAVFDAHKASLGNEKQAMGLQKAYFQFEEVRSKLTNIIEYFNYLLSIERFKPNILKYIQNKHNIKIVEAQIEYGVGVRELIGILDDPNDIQICINGLKAAGFSINQKDAESLFQQIGLQIGLFYQKKKDLLKEHPDLPPLLNNPDTPFDDSTSLDNVLDEVDKVISEYLETGYVIPPDEFEKQLEQVAKRQITSTIKLPYLKFLRDIAQLPPDSLTNKERLMLMQKELNTEEKDLTKLIQLISTSFQEADEQAIIFYIEQALALDSVPIIAQKFLSLSLKRMQEPNLFGRSIGIMLIKVLPLGTLSAAQFQPGDVIFKINDEAVMHPEIVFHQLAGKHSGEQHLFEIYRDGKFFEINVASGLPLGARLTPLISWYEIVL